MISLNSFFGTLLTETILIIRNIIAIPQSSIGKTMITDMTKNVHQKDPTSAEVIIIAKNGITIKNAIGINKPKITILLLLSFTSFTSLFSSASSPGRFTLVNNTAPQEMQCC